MPFATEPKERPSGTGRGCRAVVAAGLLEPGSEWTVFRALQIANFTGSLYLDDAESIREALRARAGRRRRSHRRDARRRRRRRRVRAPARRGALGRRHARAGSGQDGDARTGTCASPRRRSCSGAASESVVAGGWQPLLSYDTLLANFAPELERVPPPDSPEPLLEFFPGGLTTAEVALLLAEGSDPVPDLEAAAASLSALVADGKAVRAALGSDALWSRPS